MSDPQATPAPVMQLDVISDVICPWCFIGKRKLDAGLAQVDDFQINLMWRPFQLDPTTPPEGHDRKQQMIRKFGPDAGKQIFKNVLAAAEGTGINWNFDKITRTPNTLNAHRLIRWAASTGEQHQIAEALFCAYFEQALDIGDVAVLLDIGEKHGLERDLLVDLFASDRDMEQTRNDDAAARELGVTGVPAFLAGGKFMLMGAQEPEYLNLFLNKARQKLAVQ
ncbi:MAG: DsbA family oxidoreductase [Rhodobiaceae bacterium]|nr:DsbA family oxidoreductase [Rhodobiaceae bacterium]